MLFMSYLFGFKMLFLDYKYHKCPLHEENRKLINRGKKRHLKIILRVKLIYYINILKYYKFQKNFFLSLSLSLQLSLFYTLLLRLKDKLLLNCSNFRVYL